MIMDERVEFADAVSVGTPNNTTVNIGDDINIGSAKDLGQGQTVYCVIQVTTLVGSAGAATVSFQVASDAATTVSVDGTQTIHGVTGVYAVADLTAGWTFVMPLSMGDGDAATTTGYETILGFQCNETAGQALTAGNVNAFLTLDPHGWTAYPDAVN